MSDFIYVNKVGREGGGDYCQGRSSWIDLRGKGGQPPARPPPPYCVHLARCTQPRSQEDSRSVLFLNGQFKLYRVSSKYYNRAP